MPRPSRPGHVTSAYDIALMSRELILHHPTIRQYTTIWMDSLRDGASELVNTNKLIRFFDGATGLKTGSTDSALYCLSGTAERDGMELIAVIMKDATSAQRFEDAKTLLSYGFSTYSLEHVTPQEALPPVTVRLGTQATVQPVLEEGSALLLEKSKAGTLEQTVSLAEAVEAPVAKGTPLGTLTITSGEETVAELGAGGGRGDPADHVRADAAAGAANGVFGGMREENSRLSADGRRFFLVRRERECYNLTE